MKKQKQDGDILLQSNPTGEQHPLIYSLENGKRISIASIDIDFFRQLQKLPAKAKIELMLLTIEDLETYIKSKKKALAVKAEACFKQVWFDRECGLLVDFTDASINEIYFGIKLTDAEIIKKMKAGKFNPTELERIIYVFESGDEIYNPEPNAE